MTEGEEKPQHVASYPRARHAWRAGSYAGGGGDVTSHPSRETCMRGKRVRSFAKTDALVFRNERTRFPPPFARVQRRVLRCHSGERTAQGNQPQGRRSSQWAKPLGAACRGPTNTGGKTHFAPAFPALSALATRKKEGMFCLCKPFSLNLHHVLSCWLSTQKCGTAPMNAKSTKTKLIKQKWQRTKKQTSLLAWM